MDYKYLEDVANDNWTILATARSKRPDSISGAISNCPFCPGTNLINKELYRIGGVDNNWQIMVYENKYPFAPIHEVIVHSRDHHKTFDELPLDSNRLIINTFKDRFLANFDKGNVCIFGNHGEEAGESLPHPHSQLVVIPNHVKLNQPHWEIENDDIKKDTDFFDIFCPKFSKWPDEIWFYPKRRGEYFGGINDEEVSDMAKILYKLIRIMDLRHGHEFPYNYYIYPGKDWYFRLVPRIKIIGGFEVGTGVYVNTQDPKDTIKFIIEHFDLPDEEKIITVHQADYRDKV